ncbi:MAG: hypothetical protein AABY07_10335, partial [Nanoarchaeota archaeon]
INPDLINEANAATYRLTYSQILSIQDNEVRSIGILEWFKRVKLHLGYYVAKQDYEDRGKELPQAEKLSRFGAEEIDEKRKSEYSRLERILSRL